MLLLILLTNMKSATQLEQKNTNQYMIVGQNILVMLPMWIQNQYFLTMAPLSDE